MSDPAEPGLCPNGPSRARDAGRALGLLAGSIGLSILAHHLLRESPYPLDGAVVFAVAVTMFLLSPSRADGVVIRAELQASPTRSEVGSDPGAGAVSPGRLRRLALIGSVVLAFLSFGGNRFTTVNLTLWALALGLFFWLFWDRGRSDDAPLAMKLRDWARGIPFSSGFTAALVGIILVAGFFRFYHLAQTPAEMTSDHAEKILDVVDIIDGERPIFFTRNTGREPFQFYLAALTTSVLGSPPDHLTLKLGTAAFGVFTIPWIYLLGKELFGQEIGLLAAAFGAISHWAVALDRVGLRFPFPAAFATPALYFLVRALQHNRRNDWLLSGVFAGIGLHTYTPIRALPLLLIAMVVLKLTLDLLEARRRSTGESATTVPAEAAGYAETSGLSGRFWRNALIGVGAMGLICLPLARFAMEAPEMFWFRTLTRTTSAERAVEANVPFVFVNNLKNALLGFNYRGDQVAINTIPGSPALDAVTGGLTVLGFVVILWRLARLRDRRSFYMLAGLFLLTLPSTATIAFPEENPSFARMGGVAPLVMILAAIPLELLARQLRITGESVHWFRPASRVVALSVIALALGASVKLNFDWYFVEYDRHWRASGWNTTEMGAVVRGFADSVGDLGHAFHVPYPHWADTRAIGINAGAPRWSNALLIDGPSGVRRLAQLAEDPAPKLFLVHPDDQNSLRVLRERFPSGGAKLHQSDRRGKNFWIFLAPGQPDVR